MNAMADVMVYLTVALMANFEETTQWIKRLKLTKEGRVVQAFKSAFNLTISSWPRPRPAYVSHNRDAQRPFKNPFDPGALSALPCFP